MTFPPQRTVTGHSYTEQMSHSRRRVIRALTGLVAALTLLLAGPVSAGNAHDELIESEPADGVEVQTMPEEVLLEFSGDVAPVGTIVEVTGPGQVGPVIDGGPSVDGTTVIQPVYTDGPAGGYTVTWRVTSSDGHPISGEFGYSVASAGPQAHGSQSADDVTGDAVPDDVDASQSPSTDDAEETRTDRAANTAAAPAQGGSSGSSGTALWVWGVLALAIITLAGLGAAAVRRR